MWRSAAAKLKANTSRSERTERRGGRANIHLVPEPHKVWNHELIACKCQGNPQITAQLGEFYMLLYLRDFSSLVLIAVTRKEGGNFANFMLRGNIAVCLSPAPRK